MKIKRKSQLIVLLLIVVAIVTAAGVVVYQNFDIIMDQATYQNKVNILLDDNVTTSKKWEYILGGEQDETLLDFSESATTSMSEAKDTNSEKEADHNNGEKVGTPDTREVPVVIPNPDREIDKPINVNPGVGTITVTDLCTPVYAAKFRALGKEFVGQSKTFENYVILENAKIDAPTYEGHKKYFETYRQIGENLILFADEIDKGNIDTAITYLDTLIALNESVPPIH